MVAIVVVTVVAAVASVVAATPSATTTLTNTNGRVRRAISHYGGMAGGQYLSLLRM